MSYSGWELLWLFFVYSFTGWVLETIRAAVKQKRFVNKGAVNLPFCTFYGVAAVFITIFGNELRGIWLYLGSVITIAVFRLLSGRLVEKIYHEKWQEHSGERWNLEGEMSLLDTALGGILALLMMKWGNPLALRLFSAVPGFLQKILIWLLTGLLLLDIAATFFVMFGKSHEKQRYEKIDASFTKLTSSISDRIYRFIEGRLEKAYPSAQKVEAVDEKKRVFAYGCSFYKLLWLFLIGAFLGDITETIFCRITAGVWMSRSSVVWGPFSIVWGLAMAFATALLYQYQEKPDRVLFLAGTVLGGAYEYVCSVFTELVFGKVFWDYSHIPFNLGGRINLLYCFFWGIAAVVWMKGLYPKMSDWIERIPMKPGKVISWILLVFMCCNITVSGMALMRSTQRAKGIPAEAGWQEIMDERFDDARMAKIYPNAVNTD